MLAKLKLPLRQIPELDTIRFLSILLVVLHHQFFQSNSFLKWFNDHGWVGVDIFFCMSGFLITSILIKEKTRTGTIDLPSFWFRRMLRLWPSWLLTLGLSFALVWAISSNNPLVRENLQTLWWHYFLHFGNYSYIIYGKIHTLFSHFWSLAVEEHFYLFWPLLMYFLRARRAVLIAVFMLILGSWLFRLWHLSRGETGHVLSFSTHTRIDELLMGCALAFYAERLRDLRPLEEAVMSLGMVVLFWVGLVICKDNPTSIFLSSITYTVIGIGTVLLLVIALKGSPFGLRWFFRNPILSRLGILSYGVYLIHLHTNTIVFSAVEKLGLGLGEGLLAVINLIVPFFPAYLMYVFIDERFAKFRHRSPKAALPTKVGTV